MFTPQLSVKNRTVFVVAIFIVVFLLYTIGPSGKRPNKNMGTRLNMKELSADDLINSNPLPDELEKASTEITVSGLTVIINVRRFAYSYTGQFEVGRARLKTVHHCVIYFPSRI